MSYALEANSHLCNKSCGDDGLVTYPVTQHCCSQTTRQQALSYLCTEATVSEGCSTTLPAQQVARLELRNQGFYEASAGLQQQCSARFEARHIGQDGSYVLHLVCLPRL